MRGQGELERFVGRRRAGRARPGRVLLLGLTFLLLATIALTPALAHEGASVKRGFLSGVVHPLIGVDHLLAMVAVGVWGAFLGRPLVVVLPVIFPVVMAGGGLLGIAGVPMPPIELGIALSVVVLGSAIGAAYKAPVWLACALVAVFGLFHGYAHGQELPAASDPAAYGIGFILATGALHVAGIAIGLLGDRAGGRAATRVLGIGIAAAGVYFLVRAVSG